ncbi:MAG TPA: Sir2 family NAD-dependent protein deacetylase [Vicinamibacteria bacterium]|nr:Sir2 family NAD-dependent protein deacetylase [Vicinamibacteria bacterium]
MGIATPLDDLVELLKSSEQVLIFTGAGISTGSGISDFRGPQGVWKRRKPVYLQEFLASEAARVEYWDQKLEAWPSFREARPNAAHLAIADLEKADRLSMVVTQNIDGLHARAGTSPDRIVELHGTNLWVECLSCLERSDPEAHMENFHKTRKPPRCRCSGFLKPATISFGQNLRRDDLLRAGKAAAEADLVVALGSTLSVYPAASFPLEAAKRGVPYVIINRGETDHDSLPVVTLRLEGDVIEIFPQAVARALAG